MLLKLTPERNGRKVKNIFQLLSNDHSFSAMNLSDWVLKRTNNDDDDWGIIKVAYLMENHYGNLKWVFRFLFFYKTKRNDNMLNKTPTPYFGLVYPRQKYGFQIEFSIWMNVFERIMSFGSKLDSIISVIFHQEEARATQQRDWR